MSRYLMITAAFFGSLVAGTGFGVPPGPIGESSTVDPARLDADVAKHLSQGQPALALPLARKSLAVRERELGPGHFDTAMSLESLALVEARLGMRTEALEHFERALGLLRSVSGFEFPQVARVQGHLGVLLASKGDIRGARQRFAEMLSLEEAAVPAFAGGASEDENLEFFASLGRSLDRVVSFSLHEAAADPEAAALAARALLTRKGRALDIAFRQNERFRMLVTLGAGLEAIGRLNAGADVSTVANSRSKDAPILEDLMRARTRLARLANQPDIPPQQRLAAEAEVRRLESVLAERSEAMDLDGPPIELSAVRQRLGARTLLLEFAVYHPVHAAPADVGSRGRYAVFLIRRSGPIVGVDLGDAVEIEDAGRSLLGKIASRSPSVANEARKLYDLLIAPLERYLVGVDTLQIVPDGALSLVPFEALQDSKGLWLIESQQISYLTSGRDLLRLVEVAPRASPAILVGGVDYEGGSGAQVASDERWSSLPGALAEIEALERVRLLRDAKVLKAGAASETTLRAIESPIILHIASHGFFRQTPDARGSARAALLRSGVILAGANQGGLGEDDDDGILTALEASTLDLIGTQLVVLSACETGLGVTRVSEGVFGLQRALSIAGARTLVMSSWQVDDAATTSLMVAYYERLSKGDGRAQALRKVQLSLLRGELTAEGPAKARGACPSGGCGSGLVQNTWTHPYYWSSFRVTGDTRPLSKVARR